MPAEARAEPALTLGSTPPGVPTAWRAATASAGRAGAHRRARLAAPGRPTQQRRRCRDRWLLRQRSDSELRLQVRANPAASKQVDGSRNGGKQARVRVGRGAGPAAVPEMRTFGESQVFCLVGDLTCLRMRTVMRSRETRGCLSECSHAVGSEIVAHPAMSSRSPTASCLVPQAAREGRPCRPRPAPSHRLLACCFRQRGGTRARHGRGCQPRRRPRAVRRVLVAVARRRTHSADFTLAFQGHPLAGHRHQRAFPADPEVTAELNRPLRNGRGAVARTSSRASPWVPVAESRARVCDGPCVEDWRQTSAC